jgi:DNA-binding protein H-NS
MDLDPAAPAEFDHDADHEDREARRAAVLRQIRKLIEFHRVSREELSAAPGAHLDPAPPVERPPKYRHPVSGDTWDGVGAQPDWLRKALLQEGYRVAELRVAEPHPLGDPSDGG